ncbi:type IV secretory system conjugative DNA transfer family protein [Streptomyces phytophilus]|uniref:type IV secretory system conjugative DNA transfer family protein n=1 Tax=Streptomyces phytophilus TaxID=722715 RepID=UPI0015F05987|nr:TraM recognition domain-containing protein [Streptomyces phytophilus]
MVITFLPTTSPAPSTGSEETNSPLEEFLLDPSGALEHVLLDARQWAADWGLPAGAAVLLLASGVLGLWRWWRRRCHQRIATDARVVRVLPPPHVDPDGGAALWANLVGLLRPGWRRWLFGQPHLVWEYVADHEALALQVWVPGMVPPGMVERAIEAAWPGAHTRTAPATAPLPGPLAKGEDVEVAAGRLRLARSEALPIRTDFAADPLRALLGAPVGLGPQERAVVQVLARPVTGRRLRKTRRAARRLRAGRSVRPVSRVLDLFLPGPGRSGRSAARTQAGQDRHTVLETAAEDRAIVTKARGAHYEVSIRFATSCVLPAAATAQQRGDVHERLVGRAHALAAACAVFSEHNYYRRARLVSRRALNRLAERRLNRGDVMSVHEVAVLAHLPWDTDIPQLERAGARAVAPPPGIPVPGPGVKPLGLTDTGRPRPVGLHVADARQHLHILGATGSGKSELMARLILDDADAGRGLVAVDPKGDMITDVLGRLPESAASRVVLFDAGAGRPPVLNPLEGDDTARIVDNLLSIFSRVYASSWGPRTDDILRAGLLTLRALPSTPLLTDLPALLTDPAARQRAIRQLDDDLLTGFWTWYDHLSDPARAQIIAPLMNKLRGLLLRPFVRQALAGGTSTVDLEDVLDQGGICLVRISRNALGVETSRLVGSLIVARTWQATTARSRLAQHQRPDASLYLDEAHNFLNLPYPLEDMLAEARGYRLSITLAHQYLRQLPRELEEGISTNARTKIYFNASPEDARLLARHTTPRLAEQDLSRLDAFTVAVRPVLAGAEAPAFTATTTKLPPKIRGRARTIRAAAAHPRPTTPAASGRPHRPAADPRRTP